MPLTIIKISIIIIAILLNSALLRDGCFGYIMSLGQFIYVLVVLNENLDKNRYLLYPACICIFLHVIMILYNRSKLLNHSRYGIRLFRKKDIINVEEELYKIDVMDGADFEKYIANLLKNINNGFLITKVTPVSNDYGADIIAVKTNGEKYAIQCKRFNKKVTGKAVQEVKGSLEYYKCKNGIVITNNYFTKAAIQLARVNNIELWDRDKLTDLLLKIAQKNRKVQRKKQNRLV